MEQAVRDIRIQLAEAGVEVTPADMESILQAAAHIANLIGGMAVIDSGEDWALWVEIDEEDPDSFFVDLMFTKDGLYFGEEMN